MSAGRSEDGLQSRLKYDEEDEGHGGRSSQSRLSFIPQIIDIRINTDDQFHCLECTGQGQRSNVRTVSTD